MCVEVFIDVGRVHDRSQPSQRRFVVEVVLREEDLEGALAVAMVVGGAGSIEAVRASVRGDAEDLIPRYVQDLGIGVDEVADQPG